MRVSKQQLKEIIKEVLTEVENISLLEQDDEDQGKQGRINMKDPIMQKTGWYKDNPDLTIGGVLKKGKDHPAYDDAIKMVDKEKGKATDEPKAEPKKTKIAADPFQSKPDISQQMSDKEKRKNISQDDKDKLSKISQMLDKERKPQQQDEDPETAMDNAAEFLGKLHKQKGWDIEKTFEEIIDAASNPNMVRTILSTPTEKQDPYEKYISALIKNGIENGEISKNPDEIDEFELQNYLETMEADVYDNLADYAYDTIDDQVVASLKKEFKQYDVINKNLMRN